MKTAFYFTNVYKNMQLRNVVTLFGGKGDKGGESPNSNIESSDWMKIVPTNQMRASVNQVSD